MIARALTAGAAMLVLLGTAAYAVQPSAQQSAVNHYNYDRSQAWLKLHQSPSGNEETHALNVLEANGYSAISNVKVSGDQVFADASKDGRTQRLVVTREDAITAVD